MKTPTLIVNLKIYENALGLNALRFCEYASKLMHEYDVGVYVAVNPIDIRLCVKKFREVVFSQNADTVGYGAKTGHISIDVLYNLGVKGTLINHSEFKINHSIIREVVDTANKRGIYTVVCADSVTELEKMINLGIKPTMFAIEPPELIGTGRSVSKYKPETVINAVKLCNNNGINVLCGAGVSNADDVKAAINLGVAGVLVASGIVKSSDPYNVMESMIKAML